MKSHQINRFATVALVAICTLGCSNSEPASNRAGNLAQEVGAQVPSEEQAEAAANREINQQNADKAFDDLQREIEEGG